MARYLIETEKPVELHALLVNHRIVPKQIKRLDKALEPKKQDIHICPYYQGVCSLDEDILCYASNHYEVCDKYKEYTKSTQT